LHPVDYILQLQLGGALSFSVICSAMLKMITIANANFKSRRTFTENLPISMGANEDG